MELLCPHCLKRVTVSDDKSGQVLNCPLCNGVFAAPSLAPAPGRGPAPSPPPVVPPPAPIPNMEIAASSPIAMAPPPPPPPPLPPTSIQAPPHVEPPKPPPPPGDYTRKFAFRLRPEILVFVPPLCLLLIFVLSFFGWHSIVAAAPGGEPTSLNLWQLYTSGVFLAYLVFFILGLLLSVACVLFEQRWVPTLPQLAPLMPWKSLLTLTILAVTFLLFFYDYQQGVFSFPDPILLAEKIAFRLHFIALVAAALEVWAQGQRARNRPLPRFTVKW
jgi:hypothetical protein